MLPRVFAVVSDAAYFDGLRALLSSIFTYHRSSIPVFVYHRGLSDGQLKWLKDRWQEVCLFNVDELAFPSLGTWEAKQQVFAHCMGRAANVYLVDADLVLVSRVDDVFTLAEQGKIVSSSNRNETYGPEYGVYSPSLPGRSRAYIHSGALCLNVVRHWDLVGLWAFASQHSAYSPGRGEPLRLPGHGDQGTFNAIATLLNKDADTHIFPGGPWCDGAKNSRLTIQTRFPDGRMVVWNTALNVRQRLVHCTGPKWWTERGARNLARFGDKFECFQHFAALSEAARLKQATMHSQVPDISIS